MPTLTNNSPLLRAVAPPPAKSAVAAWEKPVLAMVNGAAGMTRNVMAPIIRATDPLPQVTPPVPQAIRPQSKDSIWTGISKAFSRSTAQNEQLIRDRSPAAVRPRAVTPPVQPRSPWVQSVNQAARQITTTADATKAQTNHHVAPELKPVAAALENAPQLLLSGPGGKMKAANLITGAAIDFGSGQSISGAAAKALTPGNSLTSNITQSILTPALQSLGF